LSDPKIIFDLLLTRFFVDFKPLVDCHKIRKLKKTLKNLEAASDSIFNDLKKQGKILRFLFCCIVIRQRHYPR